jgi:predicted nucleotidyltransferase
MSNQENIENNLRNLIPELRLNYNVSKLGLFGSINSDQFSDKSDVDILVGFSKVPGWEYFDLIEFLEEKLGRKIDLVTMNALKPQLKDKILSEVSYLL